MGLIVCKFGGTSLADAAQMEAVRQIVRRDSRRRLIVASAPGRRFPGDAKITDLLIAGEIGRAKARLQRLASDVGAEISLRLPPDAPTEFTVSRGEACCAQILAQLLQFDYVDAAEVIRFRSDKTLDSAATAEAIRRLLLPGRRAVIPGFYGALPDGSIHTLPRGGSDTTGALIAAALKAELYENFTDVPGLFDCDPARFPDARPVRCASCDEVRLLAHCGAGVLHEDALTPVQQSGVPIRLCSTFRPDLPGTLIADAPAERPLLSMDAHGRCAVAGPLPDGFPARLRRTFPQLSVEAVPGGITFSLPGPDDIAFRRIHAMLTQA